MNHWKEQVLLHVIVLIWGFTGILGKVISIPATSIVWYRMLIAALGLFIYFRLISFSLHTTRKHLIRFLGIGAIVALHWVLFFEALKVSTVSVTLATLSSATLFTSLLEPLFFKRKVVTYELLLGLLVIAGLVLIFNYESEYYYGIALSLASAFCASLFTTINGKLVVQGHRPRIVSFYEMLGGFLAISLWYLVQGDWQAFTTWPTNMDWFYLTLLGLICTAFAYLGSVEVMKVLSPYTVSISINMEPVYSILLALAFFGEKERMSTGFYAGTILIIGTILTNAYLKRKKNKSSDTTAPSPSP